MSAIDSCFTSSLRRVQSWAWPCENCILGTGKVNAKPTCALLQKLVISHHNTGIFSTFVITYFIITIPTFPAFKKILAYSNFSFFPLKMVFYCAQVIL